MLPPAGRQDLGQIMTQRELRVAIVGAGRMARCHLHALRRVPVPHRVLAVHDVSASAAQELAALAGAAAYPTLAALVDTAKPDIVHVCTPAGKHFEPARHALQAGAHVYVEKPFVETRSEADELLHIAAQNERFVCAGHQQLRDRAFDEWVARAVELTPLYLVDSHFTFNPPHLRLDQATPAELAAQLVDILPHPLYTLVAALQSFGGTDLTIRSLVTTPTEIAVSLSAGALSGRLFVSLRARPIASTLTGTGRGGSITADFVRSIVFGAGNSGTSPLEKIFNPVLEGWQLQRTTAVSLFKRVIGGGGYPGLVEMLGEFYGTVAAGGESPVSPAHLRCVTALYEEIAGDVRRAAGATARPHREESVFGTGSGPVAVVTGARGFLGREISSHLARRGFRVRGISRTTTVDDPNVHEWVTADLSQPIPPTALADAAVVVHAAAETAGGFEAHQRNTIDATGNLLRAMQAADVRRLVHVSSLSVLRPPRTPWERQHERTPLPEHSQSLGPYTWGKCEAERLVAREAPQLGIATRIVRPAALVDLGHPDLPGLVGRRLFGRWHLGLGRPGLPMATCEVGAAGATIAWCAERFESAPAVINLIDGTRSTRGELLRAFREHGWGGRMVWAPISAVALLLTAARTALAFARFERPTRLTPWDILRPRRYDDAVASRVLALALRDEPSWRPEPVEIFSHR